MLSGYTHSMAASALAASKKWRVAIDKAITTAKRAKFVKSEWREFSNEKIAALQSVYAASEREEVAGILTSTNSVSKLIRVGSISIFVHYSGSFRFFRKTTLISLPICS